MKKFALHMGRKVRIADNARALRKPKQMSVDAMTKQVARKFPSYAVNLTPGAYEFSGRIRIREVVLFVRKLCRK